MMTVLVILPVVALKHHLPENHREILPNNQSNFLASLYQATTAKTKRERTLVYLKMQMKAA